MIIMKRFKRIGAFLLSAAVMLSMIPAVVTAAEPAAAAEAAGEKQQILQKLQIIPEEFDVQAQMTRGDFIQIIANMLGEDTTNKTTERFIDVNRLTPQMGAIALVTEQGYIGGYTDGSFRPNDPILMVDAVKVMLAVLGYHTEAELAGGYPTGYFMTASGIRLLNGMQGDTATVLTGGQLVQMIYNTFDIPLRYQKEFGEMAVYTADKEKTFWSERRNIYRIKGIVSANAYTHLGAPNGLGKDWIQIDNLLCQSGSTGIEDYLGCRVQAYIRQEPAEDEGTVLAFEYGRYNNIVQIQSDDILTGTTLKTVEYSENGKKQRMAVSGTADLIYNGKALPEVSDSDMIPENGTLTLIDRENDGVADVVKVDSYVNYAVLSVNAQNETILDQYDVPRLVLENMEYTIVRNGFEESLLFIKEWDIVSAAVSLDGEYAKLVVTSDSFSGTIEAMGEDTVTIGEVEYKIASSQAEPMKVGDTGTFHLDMFGKVAAYQKDVSGKSYAYLVKAGMTDGIGAKLQFKVFDLDSQKEQIFDGADNLTIDEKSVKGQNAITALEESAKVSTKGKGVAQLIRYRKNSKGEISAIDTVVRTETENDNSMELSMASAETGLTYKRLLFSGKVACGAQTKVLVMPTDIERIKDFSVKTKSYFNYDEKYKLEAYCMDEALIPEVLLVYPENTGGTGNINIYYGTYTVEQVVRGINSDEESVLFLRGVMEGAQLTTEVDQDLQAEAAQLKFGDVVAVERTDGRITAIKKLYDSDNPLVYGMDGGYVDKNVIIRGKAMYKTSDILVAAINDDLTEKLGFQTTRITVVDKVNKKVRVGNVGDIVTYGETKDRDSANDVLIYNYYGVNKDIVVFVTQ